MLELLQHPVYGLAFMVLLGACVGSFLNVVILRLPVMMEREWQQQCQFLLGIDPDSAQPGTVAETAGTETVTEDEASFNLSSPASHCPVCHQPLRFWHNIPILSFLFLRGRCSYCQTAIGWRYPLVELVTLLATVHMTLHFGIGWPLLAGLFFVWSLICLTVIDLDHQLLPDDITLPLLWAGLLANLFSLFTSLESAVIGAIAGYLGFWLIYQAHYRLTGREGLGYGDFKLLAAIGAWVGWELLPLTILIASLTGTVFAVVLILLRRLKRKAPVSFGPFLAVAGWIALVWGEQVTSSGLPLFRF